MEGYKQEDGGRARLATGSSHEENGGKKGKSQRRKIPQTLSISRKADRLGVRRSRDNVGGGSGRELLNGQEMEHCAGPLGNKLTAEESDGEGQKSLLKVKKGTGLSRERGIRITKNY